MYVSHGSWSRRLHHVEQILQRLAQIRHDRGIGDDVLVDLRRIDVDVNLLRVDRVGLDVAGDAIVEPHAERDQQIGLLDRMVDPRLAVHAHHADVERVAGREAAQSEQRHRDRRVDALGELPHFLHRAALQDALPGEDHGTLRLREQIDGRRHLRLRHGQLRTVATQLHRRRIPRPVDLGLLRVLGDVDEHGTGPTGLGEDERLLHRRHDVLDARHEVAVLGDRQRDASDVRFLERVVADQLAGHLPGDADHRHRVHHRGGDAGDEVRGARTRRRHRDADAPAGPGVAVRHVRCALLVANQHVLDRIVEHRVVGREDRSARISKDGGDALVDETFPDDLRAGSLRGHEPSVHCRSTSVKLIVVPTK